MQWFVPPGGGGGSGDHNHHHHLNHQVMDGILIDYTVGQRAKNAKNDYLDGKEKQR